MDHRDRERLCVEVEQLRHPAKAPRHLVVAARRERRRPREMGLAGSLCHASLQQGHLLLHRLHLHFGRRLSSPTEAAFECGEAAVELCRGLGGRPGGGLEDEVGHDDAGEAYEGLHQACDGEGHGRLVVAAANDDDARHRSCYTPSASGTVGTTALEEAGSEDEPGEQGEEAQLHEIDGKAGQRAIYGSEGGAVSTRNGESPGPLAAGGHGGGHDEPRPEAVVAAEEQAEQDGEAQREAALGRGHQPPHPHGASCCLPRALVFLLPRLLRLLFIVVFCCCCWDHLHLGGSSV
uniref:Uncharacterized protein n=1 Tax=Oryza glumipatula TaxID=40148 RepID=A0A0E0BEC4_9ORYZ